MRQCFLCGGKMVKFWSVRFSRWIELPFIKYGVLIQFQKSEHDQLECLDCGYVEDEQEWE